MNIGNLIIEVTRKCNMSCDHCLRGDAMNLNIKKEYIDSLLDQVGEIQSVVFTGGEPTLNLPIMEYFLDEVKRKRIGVGFFYIATNGLKITEKFVMFTLRMYHYCSMKEECRVDVSNDMYHRNEGDYDISLLSGLSFFGKKFEKDGYNYGNGAFLKSEGRMESKKNKPICIDESRITPDDIENSEVEMYLNCKGEIINGCDWSYRNQSYHKLCDVGELSTFFQQLIDEQVYS